MNEMIYILTAICMSLTVPFLSYLNRQANKDSLIEVHQIEMPKAYLFIGYLMVLISLGILIGPRFMDNPPEFYHPLIWVLIFTIFLFGIYVIRLYKVHKIILEKNEFTIQSTFGQKIALKVDEIESLDISYTSYFITIKDKTGQRGKVYFHLKGLIKLLNEIQVKSGRDISNIERLLKI